MDRNSRSFCNEGFGPFLCSYPAPGLLFLSSAPLGSCRFCSHVRWVCCAHLQLRMQAQTHPFSLVPLPCSISGFRRHCSAFFPSPCRSVQLPSSHPASPKMNHVRRYASLLMARWSFYMVSSSRAVSSPLSTSSLSCIRGTCFCFGGAAGGGSMREELCGCAIVKNMCMHSWR